MHHVRRGSGKPLLLVHGLGGSWRSWNPVLEGLAAHREVIAVDLPGFGDTPRLAGEMSISTLADAIAEFLTAQGLLGIDAVGSSMGARLLLELTRRGGVVGAVVALGPGGFGTRFQRDVFYATLKGSIQFVRGVRPLLPQLAGNAATRTILFAQFSSHPWKLSPELVLDEIRSAMASPCYDEMLWKLAYNDPPVGAPRGSIEPPLVIGWGRYDHVSFPSLAKPALEMFPDARLHWFPTSGHVPAWDAPEETIRLVLDTVG